jgi:hypothetical protein
VEPEIKDLREYVHPAVRKNSREKDFINRGSERCFVQDAVSLLLMIQGFASSAGWK